MHFLFYCLTETSANGLEIYKIKHKMCCENIFLPNNKVREVSRNQPPPSYYCNIHMFNYMFVFCTIAVCPGARSNTYTDQVRTRTKSYGNNNKIVMES